MTHYRFEEDYPEWINAFVSATRTFEQYLEQRKKGEAGKPSETTKIAKKVFDFLMAASSREFLVRKYIKHTPTREELGIESSMDYEDHDIDREVVGWVRASDIVGAVLPPHLRNGSDSPNARLYPHKNKTLVYRVLSEMTDRGLIERWEVSRKKTLYRVALFPVKSTSDCANCIMWATRYLAAIEIMTEHGISSPEQLVDARLHLKLKNSV